MEKAQHIPLDDLIHHILPEHPLRIGIVVRQHELREASDGQIAVELVGKRSKSVQKIPQPGMIHFHKPGKTAIVRQLRFVQFQQPAVFIE